MDLSELILNVLSFLMLIVLAWFSFTSVNIIVTILKCKRKDKSLKFCFNSGGKILYIVLCIVFPIIYIGGLVAIIYGLTHDNINMYRVAINIMALSTLVFSMAISNVVLLGKKELMVGRMLIDYRKMKKVSFGLDDKITFVFSQKEYSFSTRFADITEIKKAVKR